MKPIIVAVLIASVATSAAFAFGLGKEGTNFGRLGAISNKKKSGGGGGPLTNLRITNTGDFRVTNTADNRAVAP